MQSGRASRTAAGAAAARALHRFAATPLLFDDPYAMGFAPAHWRVLARIPGVGPLLNNQLLGRMRPVQGQVLVRSRFAEDTLLDCLERGIDQYVIVGAGFDTFALRHRELADRLTVFELDHPATQRAKREQLAQFGPAPENLHWVAIDFERSSLADALAGSSFDASRPAFFSWLGTTPYLTQSATLGTLRAIAELACGGSEVVCDYLVPAQHLDAAQRAVMTTLERYTQRRGEPLCGQIDPDVMRREVAAMGYEIVEELDGAAQDERYCRPRGDGMLPLYAAHLLHLALPTATPLATPRQYTG